MNQGIRSNLILLGIALLAAAASVYPMMDSYFFNDDFNFLLALAHESSSAIWNPLNSVTLYFRPFSFGMIELLYRFFGDEPLGYRLVILGIHLLNVILVFRVGLAVFANRTAAFLAALFWGSFRLHTRGFFIVVNIGELMVATFVLAAILTWICYLETGRREKYLITLLLLAAGLLTKENALILPVLLGLLSMQHADSWRSWKEYLPKLLPLLGLCLTYGLLLLYLSKYYVKDEFFYTVGPEIAITILEYFGSLLSVTLFQELPLIILIGVSVLVLAGLMLDVSRSRFLLFWVILFGFPYAPFITNFPRALYIPSMGYFLLVGALLSKLIAWLPSKTGRWSVQLTALGITVFVIANIVLAARDIGQFDETAEHLRTIATQVGQMDELPEDLFIVMLNPPTENWVVEGALRFGLDRPALEAVTIPYEHAEPYMERVGDNEWTWSMIGGNFGRIPEWILILDYSEGQLKQLMKVKLNPQIPG